MKIKICSINIRFENPNDGIHNWEARKPLISNYIQFEAFDLVGSQEGREGQINSLSTEISLTMATSHRDWISERMYPTLFYNLSKFQLIESGDFWLSKTPLIPGSTDFKSSFPRLATWAKLKLIETDEVYFYLNTHLDHVLEETRIEQVKVISSMIKNINSDNFPIIIIGDFNDKPGGEIHNYLKKELSLIDHWEIKGISEETSHHAFNGTNQEGVRIDWLLCSTTFNCESIFLEKKEVNGIYLSDHFPLVATLIPN